MQTSDNSLIRTISEQFGGKWHRIYANSVKNDRSLYVFESDNSTIALIVVRNDRVVDESKQFGVPGAGIMYWHEAMEDPALKGLREFISHYRRVKVIRYRPGKRMTVSGYDARYGKVIVKCIASGVSPIYRRLSEIWNHRASLLFEIGEPLALADACNTFIQSRLPGQPLAFNTLEESKILSVSMAEAIGSLHRSQVKFETIFLCRDQELRSNRYADKIVGRFHDLDNLLHKLAAKLRAFAMTYDSIDPPLSPIHGSLHSHQWLKTANGLALIDFDRACMGHPELDLATFIAEWDYEPGAIANAAIAHFEKAYPNNLNHNVLCYYRAHKHLAKAYKASKNPDRGNAYGKTKRNLANALALAERLPESPWKHFFTVTIR